ncbi:MAG TPA: lytic murein transglycosylase [Bdellovibrionales bacterium]|nr:lytic murein transglycosylase [Bdellovibrionales bacterium]
MHSIRLFCTFALSILFVTSVTQAAPRVPKANWEFVQKKLEREKFSKAFIKEMQRTYEDEKFEEVIRLNVLLYLKKSDYHGTQVTSDAAREVKSFREANREAFEKAQTRYKVPSGVVASLLWIESRHGKNTGEFHVPSVYLNLIQAPRKDVQLYLQSQTGRYTDKVSAKDREEIRLRTYKKSKWALQELRAIEKVYRWKWKLDRGFRGSFSGAFGMPQFLPSSYIKWARALKETAQPDLNFAADAIMSVAHYLSDHGWKTDKPETRLKALMKYNNSQDYANAILNLAEQLETRTTASQPE